MLTKQLQLHQLTGAQTYDLVASQDYDNVYHRPDLNPNYEAGDRIVYGEILGGLISKTEKVLDVGAGNGDTLRWLSWKIKPENYLGVDPSHKMCAAASKLYPEYTFLSDKLQNLDLSEASYDKILSIYAPPSYETQPNKLTETVRKLLKPGGLYISGPYTHLMAFGVRWQTNIIDAYPQTPRNFFLEHSYRELLENHGFVVIDEIGIDYVTHQQVYIDSQRAKLGIGEIKSIDHYYNHMKHFDAAARAMEVPVTDFRHCLYIAKKPLI